MKNVSRLCYFHRESELLPYIRIENIGERRNSGLKIESNVFRKDTSFSENAFMLYLERVFLKKENTKIEF